MVQGELAAKIILIKYRALSKLLCSLIVIVEPIRSFFSISKTTPLHFYPIQTVAPVDIITSFFRVKHLLDNCHLQPL